MASRDHLESDGALEGQVPGLVHDAHAAPAEHPLNLVAGDLWQRGGWRRGRAFSRTCREPRNQRSELRVDELEFLPPPADFR